MQQNTMLEQAIGTNAFQSFMLKASPGCKYAMANLIEMCFTLQWNTDHETSLSEMQSMGEITMQEKTDIRETFANIALELPDYRSQ